MTIKNYIYSILAVCFLTISCSEDFLDKQPLDALSSETYWNNEDEALMAVNACYRYLIDDWWKTFYTCATDDSYAWSNWPCDVLYAGNGSATTTLGTFSHFWSFYYQAIAAANNVIGNIDKVGDIDENKRKRIAAEARFIRAYAYQQLVGLYGDVPLIKKVQTVEELYVARNPKSEVIQFLVDDINEFADDLPVVYEDQTNFGRVTQGAALTLQARIYLYNEQWTEAAAAAQKVMDLEQYRIDDDYESLFNGTNENSSEIILLGQVTDLNKSAIATWVGGPASGGWSEVVPVQSLVDAYECTDGLPIDQSGLYDPEDPFNNRDPRLSMTIIIPGSILNGDTIDITDSLSSDGLGKNNASFSGYYYKKYIPAVIEGWWGGNSTNDIIILRYAEVLLTYAEAKIEDNQIDQSVYDAINEVRSRATVSQPSITPGKTQSELIEIVRRERRVEFAMEEHRLFDIRRWKIAEQVMSGNVYGIFNDFDETRGDYGSNVLIENRQFNPGRDYLWPVPQSERDVNTKLEQNSNW